MSIRNQKKAPRKVSRSARPDALEMAVRPVVQTVRWEILEDRRLMAVDPVMVYAFDEGSGTVAADTGTGDAVANNGTLVAGNDADLLDPTQPDEEWNRQSPTINGSLPTWITPGQVGNSHLQFNGVPDTEPQPNHQPMQDNAGSRVMTANRLDTTLGGTATLSAWVKVPQGAVGHNNPWQAPAITGGEHNQANDIFWGFLDASGRLGARAGNGATAFTTPVNDGQWHRITFTRDSGNGQIRAYVDGALVSAVTSETGVKGVNFSAIGALTVMNAASLTEVSHYNHFAGELDQVEIFDRALPINEVGQRYGTATAAPTKPVATVTSPGPRTAIVTWGDVPEETAYVVRRATAAAPTTFTDVATLAAGTTTFTDRSVTTGTAYIYVVRAINGVGQTDSDPAGPVTIAATGQGLIAYHFENNFWGEVAGVDDPHNRPNNPFGASSSQEYPTLRVTNDPKVTDTVPFIDYNYGGNNADPLIGSPHPDIRDDNFSSVFQGKLVAPETGTYTFLGFGDDDIHVYINGMLVSSDPLGHGIPGNNAGGQAAIEFKRAIELNQGDTVDVVVLHAEGGGGAGAILRWILPSDTTPTDADVVPQSAFRTIIEAPQQASDLVLATVEPDGFTPTPAHVVRINYKDNSTRELLYQLERSVDNGTSWQVVNESGINANSLIDANPVAGVAQYRVVAINRAAGDNRVESEPLTVNRTGVTPTASEGAFGYFFNDQWWNARQPAGGATAAASNDVIIGRNPDAYGPPTGTDIDEDWGNNAANNTYPGLYDPELTSNPMGSPHPLIRDNRFSTVWQGKIVFPEAGTYTVLGYSDDDSHLWVGNTLASADPGGHGIPDVNNANFGVNDFVVRNPITITQADIDSGNNVRNYLFVQSEGGSGAGALLRWITPTAVAEGNLQPQIVPGSNLRTLADLPAAPSDLAAPIQQSRVAVLTWGDASTSEVRYSVARAPADAAGNPTGAFTELALLPIGSTTYTDRTVDTGAGVERYVYRVRAENFQGHGESTVNVSTIDDETVPNAPTNLVVYDLDESNRIIFTDNAVNETQFFIERKVTGEPDSAFFRIPGTPIAENGPGNTGTIIFTDTDALLQPGQTYVYRVAAVNAEGDVSAYATATAVTAGLEQNIYDADGREGARGIVEGGNSHDPIVRHDPFIDFNYGNGAPDPRVSNDHYAIVWEGEFTAPESGEFTFVGRSDDGIRVFLDGQMIVDSWVDRGPTDTASSPVTLVAGQKYPIQVQYYENGGGALAQLRYSTANIADQVVPTAQLSRPDATRPLVAPLAITATNDIADCVRIDWVDANASETGFIVQRNADASNAGGWTTIATVPANQQMYLDELAAGQSFAYRVIPVRDGTQGPASTATDAVSAQGTSGGAVNFTNFASPDTQSQWTLNPIGIGGGPQFYDLDNNGTQERLRLMSGGNLVDYDNQNGTAYLSTPRHVDGFTASFDFVMGGTRDDGPNSESANPADGFTFILQNAALGTGATGAGGGGLGYQGIAKSVAVNFDVYNNVDRVGLFVDGQAPNDNFADSRNRNLRTANGAQPAIDLDNGSTWRATFSYDPVAKVLSMTLDDLNNNATAPFVTSWEVDIPHVLGSNCGYVGFTGATGGESVRVDIMNFAYNPTAPTAALPRLSVQDVTVTEGNSGTSNATFTVTLSAPSTQTVRVNYATSNAGATAGASPNDYTATSGTLTFAPGETTKTVNVPILGDTTAEPNEAFFFTLNTPVNAAIAPGDGRAVGAIMDDDRVVTEQPRPKVSQVYVSGENWSQAFLDELLEEGLGNNNGFRLQPGAAGEGALPWSTVNKVTVVFDSDVQVQQDDLAWASGKGIVYGVKSFNYDPATRTATWIFDKPLAHYPSVRPTGDKVSFSLNGDGPNGVGNAFGLLDGGDYNFRVNVVPGDSFRNAAGLSNSSTTAQDYSVVRAAFGKSSTAEGDDPTRAYTVFKDVNTNGAITTQDLGIIRGNLGGSTAAMEFPAAPASVSITDEMFSNTAIV